MTFKKSLKNEIIEESIKDWFEIFQQHHKHKGVVDYLDDTKKVFSLLLKGEFSQAKKILKNIDEKKLLSFLLKADQSTLHLITTPIHMLDFLMGWDLANKLDIC